MTSRRTRTLIVAFATLAAFALVNVAPASADSSDYCRSEEGQGDPRCSPDYCNDQQNAEDPYCWDPNYCEQTPDDPICRKVGDPEPKKETCVWYVDGAPVGSIVPVLRGANPGPHVVRLDCPNHQLAKWECIEKGRDGTILPSTGQDVVCTYDGATTSATDCSATFVWTVVVPDFNTWTVQLTATTYKVEEKTDPLTGTVVCVGPVDWNTSEWIIGEDGTLRRYCVLENEFLAKDHLFKSDGKWHHYTPGDNGTYDYHTHPNRASMPDGKIDECDFQTYSIQWRQYN